MNEHVQAAKKQDKSPEGEVPAPEFDAMTWGAEEALKAMVEIRLSRCVLLGGERLQTRILAESVPLH